MNEPIVLIPAGPGVSEFLQREHISPEVLERMLATGAHITHEWGNRRFFDYVFLIEGGVLVRIGNMAKGTVSSGGEGDFIVYEDCPACDGHTKNCVTCHGTGELLVTRKVPKDSTTFGVMQ